MTYSTAQTAAHTVFADYSDDEVRTAYVSTFVQVGRFTAREARDVRRWAVAEVAAREGEQAASDFVEACHA
jgi:hypothetical protein